MNRAMNLCKAFGWQGGTVHQIAEEIGCSVHDILYAKEEEYLVSHKMGWFSYRTNSLEFNTQKRIQKENSGNLQFWLGVASGVECCMKQGMETPKKF